MEGLHRETRTEWEKNGRQEQNREGIVTVDREDNCEKKVINENRKKKTTETETMATLTHDSRNAKRITTILLPKPAGHKTGIEWCHVWVFQTFKCFIGHIKLICNVALQELIKCVYIIYELCAETNNLCLY